MCTSVFIRLPERVDCRVRVRTRARYFFARTPCVCNNKYIYLWCAIQLWWGGGGVADGGGRSAGRHRGWGYITISVHVYIILLDRRTSDGGGSVARANEILMKTI